MLRNPVVTMPIVVSTSPSDGDDALVTTRVVTLSERVSLYQWQMWGHVQLDDDNAGETSIVPHQHQ